MAPGSVLKDCIKHLTDDEVNFVTKKELKNFKKENFQKLMKKNSVHVAIFKKKIKGKKDEKGKQKFEKIVRVYYPHRNSNKLLTKKDLNTETRIVYLNGKKFFLLKPM